MKILRAIAACLFSVVLMAGATAGGPGNKVEPGAESQGNVLLAAVSAASRAEILERVRQTLADYYSVPKDDISEETDLLRDLFADPMDALEMLAMICEEFGVDVPPRSDLVTVRDIVDYVDRARSGERTRGAGAPATANDKPQEWQVQKVFYATDRARFNSSNPNNYYGGDRASQGRVEYGICEVTIPIAVHKRGKLERPSLINLEDPRKHIVLRKVDPLAWSDFLEQLKSELDAPPGGEDSKGDAFVFIHGFNVRFDAAARRTAQMAYDLQFGGVPILFSWPSDGSPVSYLSDREDVEWSVPHIEAFFDDLLKEAKVNRLHLVAHSMGNQGLLRALNLIALRRGDHAEPLFENVILAAPDFDAQVFTDQLAPRIVSLSRHWTLYASDRDRALDASEFLSVKRLGLPLSVAKGVDTVDASGIDVTPWSVLEFHSYYASKQRVIADVIGVLRGLSPAQRGLKKQTQEEGRALYWLLETF